LININISIPSFILNRRNDRETGEDSHLIGSDLDLMALLDLSDEEIESKNEEVLELTVELSTRYGVFISIVKNNIGFFNEWVDTLPYFKNVIDEGINIYG